MTPPTHAVTVNGHTSMELESFRDLSDEDELVQRLRTLDGVDSFALVLWKLPEGVAFADVDVAEASGENYMQCAGRFSGSLTCEIRDPDGHFVLGRASDADEDAPIESVIEWNAHRTLVRENEVLSGDEVAELFVSYLQTGHEPDGYIRREIDV
jgi:hypothetical protein